MLLLAEVSDIDEVESQHLVDGQLLPSLVLDEHEVLCATASVLQLVKRARAMQLNFQEISALTELLTRPVLIVVAQDFDYLWEEAIDHHVELVFLSTRIEVFNIP